MQHLRRLDAACRTNLLAFSPVTGENLQNGGVWHQTAASKPLIYWATGSNFPRGLTGELNSLISGITEVDQGNCHVRTSMTCPDLGATLRWKSAGGIARGGLQCDRWQDHTSVGVGRRHTEPARCCCNNKSRCAKAGHSCDGRPVNSCLGCRRAHGGANSAALGCSFDRKGDPRFRQHREAQISRTD
jgi:hypothetical protein